MLNNWHSFKREQQLHLLGELIKKLTQDAKSVRDVNLGFVRPRRVIRTLPNIQKLLLKFSESRLEFIEEFQTLFSLVLLGDINLHRSIHTFLVDIQSHELSASWKENACMLIAESLLKTDENDEIADLEAKIKSLEASSSVSFKQGGDNFELLSSVRSIIKLIEKKVALNEANPPQERLTKFQTILQSLQDELQKITNEFESVKSQVWS